MSKTALLFAGQGAQKVGMGKELAATHPRARELFDQANDLLGYDLAAICFQGPDTLLTQTEHAQPGIYLLGWITFQLLQEAVPNLTFDATAGLSLGEFTALAAAGVLSFEDGLRLVRARGQFMQEACEKTEGNMAAVIGLDDAATQTICDQTGVQLANLNCPGQLVISGETERVGRACDLAKQAGARRALPLPVAGAYHSPLMAGAQTKLATTLRDIPLSPPQVTVISNVTAQPHADPESIRQRMVEQVTSPVRWEEGIRLLLQQGFTRFIELGPGKALSGFLKRIDPAAQALNVDNVPSLQTTAATLTS